MNVKQIVARALKAGGYDGLCNLEPYQGDGCGCKLGDLAPCGEPHWEDCRAGYLQADGTIGPGKPKKGKAK